MIENEIASGLNAGATTSPPRISVRDGSTTESGAAVTPADR
jgi:hypothetical protein